MSAERWTLYQLLPRKGWLAMRSNVEPQDVKPPVDDQHALDSRWVRNDLAAGAHGEGPVWVPTARDDHFVRLDHLNVLRVMPVPGEPEVHHLYAWSDPADEATKYILLEATREACRAMLDQLRALSR